MRISISVPDDIHEAADDLADELDVSRSRLYATAVAEYVAKYRHADVTAKLDELYRDEASEVAADVRSAQRRSVVRESW